MPTCVERDSNLRRLQMFLAGYALNLDLIAKVIFALLPVKTGLVLSLDRTNWKFGEVNINILMLGVTYKGVAFPLLFTMLDKRGNSNWKERTRLIDRFIRLFGAECIDSLVADREFVGKEWVEYLNNRRIRYYLWIKQNFWLRNPKSCQDVRAWHLFHGLKLGQERVFDKLFLLKGEYVYISGALLKNSDGVPELQILICYNRPEEAVATYKQRWQIETCFRAMKSSGFNIEDTRLRDIDRIARLTAMVCIALAWAYLVGEHKDINVKAIRILKHGKRAKSLIKYGLEEIANVLLRPLYKPKFMCSIFCSYLNHCHNYHGELMWEGVDLYMDNRWYGREFCVKWVIGDSLNKLTQIDKLRPVINKIIRKAGFHSFAFGVKPNDTTVTTCLPPILD